MYAVANNIAILGIGPNPEAARVEAMIAAQTWLPEVADLMRADRNTSASLYMAPVSPDLYRYIVANGTPDSWDEDADGTLIVDTASIVLATDDTE